MADTLTTLTTKPLATPATVSFQVGGKTVLIDEDDVIRVAGLKWHLARRPNGVFYVKSHPHEDVTIRMHRMILQAPDGVLVDHWNLNGLDNRKANLRLCTKQQNTWNVPMRRDNTSGLKGAIWHSRIRKWQANYNLMGRKIHIGYFETPEEAHAAYVAALAPMRGEFLRTA